MYIFFENENVFNEWHSKVNEFYGFPNNEGTERYTVLEQSEDNKLYAAFLDGLPEEFLEDKIIVEQISVAA